MNMDGRNDILTPAQVAGLLKVHVATVYSYIRRGSLEAVVLGRNYRIMAKDLESFIESHRTGREGGHGAI